MVWSVRPRDRDPPGPTGTAESDRTLEVQRHSPGLEVALAMVHDRQSVRVLDLGPAVSANFVFLSAFCQHVRFVDLLADGSPLSRLADAGEGELRRRVGQLLPSEWGVYDLVIAWDLINYVDQAGVEAVVERLRTLCRDGATLFAMIATTDEIPAHPPEYTIVDRSTVMCRAGSAGAVECFRRPPAVVGRLLSGFSVERSFILRHGAQEYVAVRH